MDHSVNHICYVFNIVLMRVAIINKQTITKKLNYLSRLILINPKLTTATSKALLKMNSMHLLKLYLINTMYRNLVTNLHHRMLNLYYSSRLYQITLTEYYIIHIICIEQIRNILKTSIF